MTASSPSPSVVGEKAERPLGERKTVTHLTALVDQLDRSITDIRFEIATFTSKSGPPSNIERARNIALRFLALREKLRQLAGHGVVQDPACDIMLDIFSSQSNDRRSSVTDVCAGLGIPESTIRRWINKLQRAGLLSRSKDPDDRRREWVDLSPAIYAQLATLLEAVG